MLKSSPETNIDANWLKTELLDSLEILFVCAFRVRAIAYDNHPLNCSLVSRNCLNMSASIRMNYIWYTSPKKSFFATTLSIKNVRDNLLNVDGLYSCRLNFLDLKIQSLFLESTSHRKHFTMSSKKMQLTCQLEERTRANDKGFYTLVTVNRMFQMLLQYWWNHKCSCDDVFSWKSNCCCFPNALQ